MATARIRQQKKSSLRRLAAKNFLSNISLDGSHSDTNYLFHAWRKHRLKNEGNAEKSESSKESVTVNVMTVNGSSDNEDSLVSEATVIERQREHDFDQPLTSSPRSRSSTMYQITEDLEHKTDNDMEKASAEKIKRYRAASYSGDKDKTSVRKRLIHLTDNVPTIRENTEKPLSRHSSSISGDSVESHDANIRFISPDSKRRIKLDSQQRILIVSNSRIPLVMSSTLPYIKEIVARHEIHDELPPIIGIHRNRHLSGTKSISSTEDMFLLGQKIARGDDAPDVSYSELLEPSRQGELRRTASESKIAAPEIVTGRVYTRSVSEDPHVYAARGSIVSFALDRVVEEEESTVYDPNLLDDPELQSGGYRTVLNFSSYMTSVIDYVKPSTLKKELNEKFKERFPNIQLTLTKFRSLKKELRSIGHTKCSIDLWTVAQSYVFFEKLILKKLISKQNRKLCAGACLMLSAKLNDIKGPELSKLITEIEDDFRLNRKEMLAYEFATLVALEFSLLIPDSEIYPHYQRLLYQS